MVKIVPFKAVRPAADKVHLVASRSYVSYNKRDLERKLTENPYTFIHIINPEFGQINKTRPNSRERFKKVREKYEEFLSQKILLQDDTAGFYIYRQTTLHTQFTGIIAGISIDHYFNGEIKVHEQTLTKREMVFRDYLDVCNFNAEPVLLTHEESSENSALITGICNSNPPLYDFSTTDKVRHQIWQIKENSVIETIQKHFEKISEVYIADGHHRTASSARLGELRRQQNPNFTGKEMYNYVLAFMIPKSQLSILQFNRLVKSLNGLSEAGLLQKLESSFTIQKEEAAFYPKQMHQFGLRLASGWYSLRLKQIPDNAEPLQKLDSYLLSELILGPHLGIQDLKTDKRIVFCPGNSDISGFEKQIVQGKAAALFTLFPASVDQVFDISNANQIMPPKSTYIDPKLRSGLTIMSLEH